MEKSISGEESSVAIAKLAKEVLAEIPTQLTSYMKINDIQPCQPKDSSGPLKFANNSFFNKILYFSPELIKIGFFFF